MMTMKFLKQHRRAFTFLALIALFAACTSGGGDDDDDDDDDDDTIGDDDDDDDDDTCTPGSTQGCTCTNGDSGAQTCSGGGSWGQCVCDGEPLCDNGETQSCACPGGGSGAQTCFGEIWGDCEGCEKVPQGPEIGDPCEFNDDCEDGAQPMLCVVQQSGDIQGICTITCGDFADCLGGNVPAFYDCCDLFNGTAACAPSDWECRQ